MQPTPDRDETPRLVFSRQPNGRYCAYYVEAARMRYVNLTAAEVLPLLPTGMRPGIQLSEIDRDDPVDYRLMLQRIADVHGSSETLAYLCKQEIPLPSYLPNRDARAAAFNDVLHKRMQQDIEHGGMDHDQLHTPDQWLTLTLKFLGRAATAIWNSDRSLYRAALIDAAAVIMAAIEVFDHEVKHGMEDSL